MGVATSDIENSLRRLRAFCGRLPSDFVFAREEAVARDAGTLRIRNPFAAIT